MGDLHMGEVETRFANIIWQNEPVPSGELVKLAKAELDWKKSTTYTVLKRLCERGIFQNEGGIVTSLVNKAEFSARQSEEFVNETFEGSLPAFVAAFGSRKKLSEGDLSQLEELIQKMRRE